VLSPKTVIWVLRFCGVVWVAFAWDSLDFAPALLAFVWSPVRLSPNTLICVFMFTGAVCVAVALPSASDAWFEFVWSPLTLSPYVLIWVFMFGIGAWAASPDCSLACVWSPLTLSSVTLTCGIPAPGSGVPASTVGMAPNEGGAAAVPTLMAATHAAIVRRT
jgi:hypothetical protein